MAIARLAFQSTLPIQGETSVTAKSFSGIGFQSTLPIQGETPFRPKWIQARRNFNPLSLYRERRRKRAARLWRIWYFNPLSLYRERQTIGKAASGLRYFNPLSLYRERQGRKGRLPPLPWISIHSPYTGRDTYIEVG